MADRFGDALKGTQNAPRTPKKDSGVLVIGLGRFGSSIAATLVCADSRVRHIAGFSKSL